MTDRPVRRAAGGGQAWDPAPLVLAVSVGEFAGHRVLMVTGDLVTDTTELLRKQLNRTAARDRVVVDLTRVRSLDAGGLAVLVDTQRRRTPRAGCMHVVTSPAGSRLLTATGLWRTLRPFPSQQAAADSCPYSTGQDQTEHSEP